MSRLALALVMVAASVSAASAGGFVGLGIGTSPAFSEDLAFTDLYERDRSQRLQVGYRFGHFSVEGFGSRAVVESVYGAAYDWTSFALAGRANLELGNRFEVFGRLGVQHTELDLRNSADDYAGSGLMGGVGIEYRMTVGGIGLSAVMDYTLSRSSLSNPSRDGGAGGDATSRVWTLGGIVYF